MKRCPFCGGKVVLLKKSGLYKTTRDSLQLIENRQLVRCKKCKKEMKRSD